MVGHIGCDHSQRGDAASAGRNGAIAVPDVGIFRLVIVGNRVDRDLRRFGLRRNGFFRQGRFRWPSPPGRFPPSGQSSLRFPAAQSQWPRSSPLFPPERHPQLPAVCICTRKTPPIPAQWQRPQSRQAVFIYRVICILQWGNFCLLQILFQRILGNAEGICYRSGVTDGAFLRQHQCMAALPCSAPEIQQSRVSKGGIGR